MEIRGAPDDAGLRLTTGRYYTSAHRAIEEHGIEPDVTVIMTDEEKKDFYLRKYQALEKIENGDVEEEEPSVEPDLEEVLEGEEVEEEEPLDPQLRSAVDILKGILIQQEFDREAGLDS